MEDPVVEIRGLARTYGDFQAVAGLDLEVRRGEVFSLLGPNGAGKTTTIRMIMGILRPSSGEARIHGFDCFTERAQVMRHVGYLPDEPIFYDYLRGREILQFVAEMHGLTAAEGRRRATPLIERLDLKDALDEYAVNYSKGMKKKLAVVCGLLHEPDVLILDEPTNGLDPWATRTFHQLLKERSEAGNAIFFSTHLLDQAERLSDRVGIVDHGRLVAVGPLGELRDRLAPGGSLEEIFFSVTSENRE